MTNHAATTGTALAATVVEYTVNGSWDFVLPRAAAESGRGWRLTNDSLHTVGAPPSYPAAQAISQATPRLKALDGCG